MSRHLPDRPDLGHLRKQAKELLAKMREADPTARLADAQYNLACDYGFPSWPKLKAYIQSVTFSSAGSSGLDRYGDLLAGRWIANPDKSPDGSLNHFNAAELVFDVDGGIVTIVDMLTDSVGPLQHRNVLHTDGEERPAQRDGYSILARWSGPHRLEVIVKQGNSTEGQVAYEVSGDGCELTVVAGDRRVIFDRGSR